MSPIESGLFALLGFLSGSIPFGLVLVRACGAGDVRSVGSGNIGATNVGRVLGRKGFVGTLLLDAAKGAAPVAAATALAEPPAAAAAAFGAVLGHCYTPWLRFRGGKGVATLLGAFGVLTPTATVVCVATLGAVVAATRMMSLGGLSGTVALIVTAWVAGEPTHDLVAAILTVLVVFWRHRGNIERILAGAERRLGSSEADGRRTSGSGAPGKEHDDD